MDKNLFLAIILSILVYIGWFAFVEKRLKPPPQPKPVPEQAAAKKKTAPPARRSGGEGADGLLAARPEEAAAETPEPEPERRAGGLKGALPFRADELRIRIQPRGASIVSYEYPAPLGDVDLIHDAHPGFFSTWPGLKFRQAADGRPVFTAKHPSGARITKEYVFRGTGKMHALRITLRNPGRKPVQVGPWALRLGPGMGTVPSELKDNARLWSSAALLPPPPKKKRPVFEQLKVEFDKKNGEKVPQVRSFKPPWRWLAVENRYFLAAVFPPERFFSGYSTGAVFWKSKKGFFGKKKLYAPWLRAEAKSLSIRPGESVVIEIPFYFGPKGYSHLQSLGLDLERSVSFGWFNRLGRLTLKVLEYLHGWTGNWGWAIILLTIFLQIILFPLTYKQMKSMAIMKQIQPQVQKIQKKFAKDQRRMQVEMMEIYKKHGANPLSGCLPMVVQFPVFIALFNMLRSAWELHGAPWAFWIHDLSAKDPFYVLPIIMGGIMFLQNKMNPQTAADPSQAKMMTYLPVIFTFMFLNFPAGLVLYWLTNSLLSFGIQLAIKRKMDAAAA